MPGSVGVLARDVASSWHRDGVAFLTVRTGFDLMLQALALPQGSEVVCTAVNIPDMFDLLEHHGLVRCLSISIPGHWHPGQALEAALTERTRAILVPHLVGTRVPMDSVHAWPGMDCPSGRIAPRLTYVPGPPRHGSGDVQLRSHQDRDGTRGAVPRFGPIPPGRPVGRAGGLQSSPGGRGWPSCSTTRS